MKAAAKHALPVIVGVAVLVGGASFFGGMKYAQAHSTGMRSARLGAANGQNAAAGGTRGGGPGSFRAGMNAGGPNGGFINGEVLSNDGKTLTVKLRDGGSKLVLIGESTEFSKFVAGTAADLEVGKTVMVVGKANSDGSVTASSIQLRPAMMPGMPIGVPPAVEPKK